MPNPRCVNRTRYECIVSAQTVPSDKIRELQDRRDFLLRSIDDLEREHAAGDLTQADFDLLHRDYSRRAADVLKELDGVAPPPPPPEELTDVERSIARKARLLRVAAWGGIAAFAVASGVFVANIAGIRTGNDSLTGSINAAAPNTSAAKVAQLVKIGREKMTTDPATAIRSFDAAVELDPTQIEALTYGGWLLRLISREAASDADRSSLLDGALERLDRAINTDPGYPDARAFRGIIRFRDLNDPKAAIEDFAILDTVTVPDEVAGLVGNARVEAEQAAAALP
jgi:tetratricopeptide (TPR) repeat protein